MKIKRKGRRLISSYSHASKVRVLYSKLILDVRLHFLQHKFLVSSNNSFIIVVAIQAKFPICRKWFFISFLSEPLAHTHHIRFSIALLHFLLFSFFSIFVVYLRLYLFGNCNNVLWMAVFATSITWRSLQHFFFQFFLSAHYNLRCLHLHNTHAKCEKHLKLEVPCGFFFFIHSQI